MTPSDWSPHRRDDGELVGWIRSDGEDWVPVDLLGRDASGPVDWLVAEERLEEIGLSLFAGPWILEGQAGGPLRVQIVEVTPGSGGDPGRIVVKTDDYGDMSRPASDPFILPWPIPSRLRLPQPGDPDGRVF